MLRRTQTGEIITGMIGVRRLAWLVSKPALTSLTATQDVFVQGIAVPRRLPWSNGSIKQRPATTYPMAVASIHELVRPTRKASFWRVLPVGEPHQQGVEIKVHGYDVGRVTNDA